ncbi:DUF6020 family protein [Adlercreutzia sp. ZJ242]|uniref:DUF6020 family protein n=1 Tax=Adlercreutzia sp. ZJ242 TaxID=2709409 RepID=UPI0013EB4EA7|nr:DUF6020 family protein [Adlercreutzia sp. ZJ242]
MQKEAERPAICSKLEPFLNKDSLLNVCVVLCALGSSAGIQFYIQGEIRPEIIFLACVPLYFMAYKKLLKETTLRLALIAGGEGLVFSSILILGNQLDTVADIYWSVSTLAKIILLALSLFPLICFFMSLLSKRHQSAQQANWTRKTALITFAVAAIFHIIVLLALFPGVYGYDAGFQILSFLDQDTGITSHFSVLYTVFLGGFTWFGLNVLNSAELGLALAMLLQAAVSSLAITSIAHCVFLLCKGKLAAVFTLLFFCLSPLYLVLTVSSAQDALFGSMFALLFSELVKAFARDRLPLFNLVTTGICTLLLILLRNNGLYVVLFALAFCLILWKRSEAGRRVAVVLASSAAISFAITGPLYAACGIVPGDSLREMLSVPAQQIARVYNYPVSSSDRELEMTVSPYLDTEKDSPSEQHLQGIDDYVDGSFEFYEVNPSISDAQKSALDTESIRQSPASFLRLYFEAGLRYPEEYTEAFLMNSLGFWYPNKDYPDKRMYHPYIEYQMLDAKMWNEKYLSLNRTSLLPAVEESLSAFFSDAKYQTIPVVSVLWNNGTYFCFFIFVCAYLFYEKRITFAVPLALAAGLLITYLLSPVCIFRYCFAFVSVAPVLMALLFSAPRQRSTDADCARPAGKRA